MQSRMFAGVAFVLFVTRITLAFPAGEYAKHFAAFAAAFGGRGAGDAGGPIHVQASSESMTFGELMLHVAITNYAFCAGLKDAGDPVATMLVPAATDKDAVVKLLSGSFDYCSVIIPQLSEEQLAAVHGSPDGRLPGREALLAMFIHVAHHRGQAEIYLRDKGIKPPSYRI